MLKTEIPEGYSVNSSTQADASEGLYDQFFLKDSIQTVEIIIDENNLNYLLQNAADEPSVLTDSVTIGGETVCYTGLKTKGNYTLSHSFTDNAGSDRFSFTVNFGKYVKKSEYGETQNFYGVSKISFNNFFFDKTMMKEFMALTLMAEMGLPTPQFGLAKLYINGEYYGVYFMVESYDTSILEQYYNVDDDELGEYMAKPTSTLVYDDLLDDASPLWEEDDEMYEEIEDILPDVMAWVKQLNQLSEGKDFDGNSIDVNSDEYLELLAEIMDIDEVVRYFAAHSFLVQMDSMFTNSQNYGLYIGNDGVALLIPWDYDLSFGCYYPSDAETTANYNIDIMYKSENSNNRTTDSICSAYEDYPLFHVIYQNESLRELYHTYLLDCSKIAALGGTTSFGETYDPAYLYSFIKALKSDLTDAASEELASNVYYMNNISQPSGVKNGLTDLGKIIAMRAIGVAAQVTGIDATVCGEGCDLSNLGNGASGWNSTSGDLITIDYSTGIYAIANYGESTGNTGGGGPFDMRRNTGTSPTLTAIELTTSNVNYNSIVANFDEDDCVIVYQLNTTGDAESSYSLSIPLASAFAEAEGEILFYSYSGGELGELTMTVSENIYTTVLDSLSNIVIVQKGGNALSNPEKYSTTESDDADTSFTTSPAMLYTIVAVALVAILATVTVLVIKKRRKSTNEIIEDTENT